MNKQNLTIAAMAAFLALSMTAVAFAGPGQGRGVNRGTCYQQNGSYSQLTPEKQQAVQAIVDKYDAKFDELRTQMWTKHSVLQALINGGNADEKKIAGLTSDITKLRDQLRDTRDAMRVEIEKETGLVGFGAGYGRQMGSGYGRHMGPGSGRQMGSGYGMGNGPGYGMGNGPGYGMGTGPCVTN